MNLILPKGPRAPKPWTARERAVAELIKDGLSTKEIAFELGITNNTAEAHRYNLMRKVGARNVAGVIFALGAQEREAEVRIRLSA